jgi:hypothetical protein
VIHNICLRRTAQKSSGVPQHRISEIIFPVSHFNPNVTAARHFLKLAQLSERTVSICWYAAQIAEP